MPLGRAEGDGRGRFTFDYPAFAAAATVTLEMVGKERTLSCTIPLAVRRQLR
jgi:hypothetical protein